MHPDLQAALKAGWPIVHLVTVTLRDHTIRWTDSRSFVKWGDHTWKTRDAVYGVLDGIGDIVDGIEVDAAPVSITIIPPDLSSMAALAASDAQGGWVTIHMACIHPTTGLIVEPYRLHLGELDQPRLKTGDTRKLEYDVITGDARGLQPNEEQRQTDAFRQLIWPGELGDEYATEGTAITYWRADEPRNSIGILNGRGGGDEDNKAIEFSYEPNAPLMFPIGRCGVGGSLRYRKGYGPTNRWQSIVATVGASGPIKGLVSAAFDDETTTFDGNDRATNGSHAREMWFKFLPGAQPSVALTSPTGPNAPGIPAPGWTTNHKLSGRPCFMWTGKENSKESEYRKNVPKPTLTIEGLYGYDPLLDSTAGGVGACRLNDPSTWPWMQEGARAALNWAIGRWEGSNGATPPKYGVPYQSWAVGGIAAPIETIDVPAFANAAQIADANGWTAAGVPTSEEDKVDVLDDLLRASGAKSSRKCGMLSCVSFGAPVDSVLTATQADTVAPPEVSLAPSRLDRRNTGVPSFLSEANRWEMTPIKAVTDAAWVAEDGGRNTDGYDYRFVRDANQAAVLCYLEIANEREKAAGEASCFPWMMRLEPGDAFDWDEPEYQLTNTKVRVFKRTWSPSALRAKIEYREETDAKYVKAFEQTGSPPPPFEPSPPPPPPLAPAERPISWSDPAPISGGIHQINVSSFTAIMSWGETISVTSASITGLGGPKTYGVFWRDDLGIEVEEYPALGRMSDGGWVFLGWQSTADLNGVFPTSPILPPGNGGTGVGPTLPPNESAPAIVAGTPALTINTGIAADGTEASLLTSSWSGVTGASSYDIEIDDGAGGWFESSPVASLKNIRVRTGLTYRVRIRAVNRDGVRSASWSAWSASVAAGGDTTAPGPIFSTTVTALPRRCVLEWENPPDDDFSHVRIYRNTTGSAHTEDDLYALSVMGTTFTDTDVQAGVLYLYAGRAVDRTGNIGIFKYIGAATPTYITSTSGGGVTPDILPTDPFLVTEYGVSAAVQDQGVLATLNVPTYASNGAAISDGQSNGVAFYNTTTGKLDTVIRTPGDGVGSIFATPGLNTNVSGASASWTLAVSKDVASVPVGATLDPMVDAPGGGTSPNPSASANFVFRLTEQLVSGGTEVTITEGDISIVSGDLALPGGGYQVTASAATYTRYQPATKSGSVRYRLYVRGETTNDTSLASSFTAILRIFNP